MAVETLERTSESAEPIGSTKQDAKDIGRLVVSPNPVQNRDHFVDNVAGELSEGADQLEVMPQSIEDIKLQVQSKLSDISADEELKAHLESTIPALISLSDQLRRRLRNGHWEVIIGDDTSGRLPALFVHYFARNADEIAVSDRSVEPATVFVAAGYEPGTGRRKSDIRDTGPRLDSLDLSVEDRVLIVTEVCTTGLGLSNILQSLSERGIGYDLATVFSGVSAEELRQNLIDLGVELPEDFGIFIGELVSRGALNEAAEMAAGVIKQAGKDTTIIDESVNRQNVEYAIKFMRTLADQIKKGGVKFQTKAPKPIPGPVTQLYIPESTARCEI